MPITTIVAANALTDSHVADFRAFLRNAKVRADYLAWVEEGSAWRFSSDNFPEHHQAMMLAFPDVDIVSRSMSFDPKLLIADMDSTMITCECIDELADYAGIKPEIAAITERAMLGELDFTAALAERVALLAGLPEAVIEQCLAERVQPTPGAETLVRTLAARGTRTVLVSGGFTRFAEPVAEMIGFDRAVANMLEIAHGTLTGRVVPPIVDGAAKLATLQAECAALGIPAAEVLAIGDGANDVPMLMGAGLGVAYHGHSAAVAAADAAVRHGGLEVLLYALGVPKADWMA